MTRTGSRQVQAGTMAAVENFYNVLDDGAYFRYPNSLWITGTSAGIGRVMIEHVLAQGDIAVATLRKPEDLADLSEKYDARLLVLKLNVKIQMISSMLLRKSTKYIVGFKMWYITMRDTLSSAK
ncbi:hypothetical protein M422DRAFT_252294 [Sphaerobolus stellatus SS14]|uniref:Uncharacterized protein n=1 Tax=Sphaerobolus stellatus (strain SS14) TaxID=990650 RepID=A0A0C9VBD7_SPHS4|nr:hypothetical protein M422DRAFT_252294 [Sphaerobolus stellatus SS14]